MINQCVCALYDLNLPCRNNGQCQANGLQTRVDIVRDTKRVVELDGVNQFNRKGLVTGRSGPCNSRWTSTSEVRRSVQRQGVDERKENGEGAVHKNT
jgi:hypothetical protein